ncbi:MAG: hypothetical protein ABIK44_02940, partial [candidate division WOR-3 bacterium]
MSSEQERAPLAQGQPDRGPNRQSALAGVSEEELVERAKAQDELALEELYRRFYDGIYFLALRQLRDEERAREVAVESFADAFRG